MRAENSNEENHKTLLTQKYDLNWDKLIVKEYFKDKIPLRGTLYEKNSDSDRRIELDSEVKYYRQIYISDGERFFITNTDYKTEKTSKIASMTEKFVREGLVGSRDGDEIWAVFHESLDSQFYNSLKTCKSYKTFLEANQSENKEAKPENLDGLIYIRLFIKVVIYPPPTVNDISNFHKFLDSSLNNIRYFIKKELFAKVVPLANKASKEIFEMNKKIKEKLTPKLLEEFKAKYKLIFSNKTLAIMNQPAQDKKGDYFDCIKEIDQFFKIYKIENDATCMKLLLRKVTCYKLLFNFKDALRTLEEDCSIFSDKPEFNETKNDLLSLAKNKKNEGLKKGFLKNMNFDDLDKAYTWEEEAEKADLDFKVSESEELALRNLNFN